MEMEITFDFRMHPIVGAKTRFRDPSDRASRLQESRQTMPLIWNPWLDRQKNLKRLKKLRFFFRNTLHQSTYCQLFTNGTVIFD